MPRKRFGTPAEPKT
ncbi:hypothetical protein A2U01_0017796, partial [Trifolium medium]|nr:hypothetical protein [Trifolium medium]